MMTISTHDKANHAISALLCACLRLDVQASQSDDLARRIAAVGWDGLLARADTERLGSVLLRAIARLRLAPPVPAMTLPDGRMTITKALAQREADHVQRRLAMRECLAEIVAALNRHGIVPVVLKGGRSLVAGGPDWRSLRDIDLLVGVPKAAQAQAIVMSLGYAPTDPSAAPFHHHHLRELYRRETPGWIEIHRYAGVPRVEQFLPTAELLAASEPVPQLDEGHVSVLPRHLHVLHGLIHHHIGHRAVALAELPLKGLFEFAAEVNDLNEGERRALLERAARHPRLLAILELWTAAAAELFGMPVLPPFSLAPDAVLWWSSMRSEGGIGPELRAATRPDRMRRAHGGERALRRLYWRLTTPLTFINRPLMLSGRANLLSPQAPPP
jgi:hypothetical protein